VRFPEIPVDQFTRAMAFIKPDGDVFFAAVNVARRLNVDPELALRTMARRFVHRVERAEQSAAAEGKSFADLELDDQDRYFDRAKEEFG